METCCAVTHEGQPPVCPMNGQPVKPVGRMTVESLVEPDIKSALLPQPYYYCGAPGCDVVYVSALGDHVITKDQLTVRVGAKESEDPILLCYCFGYDRQAVRNDVRATGTTEIPQMIAARVRAGECTCELTNPKGTCCLGDVRQAVKQVQALREKGAL